MSHPTSPPGNTPNPDPSKPGQRAAWEELVLQQVKSLKFGTVQITIQDSKVVQVEKVERMRIEDKR